MKIRNEDLSIKSTTSVSAYLDGLHKAQKDEMDAIKLYDELLSVSNIPESARTILEEVRDDEKDHLALISALISDEVQEEMPLSNEDQESFGMVIEEESDED